LERRSKIILLPTGLLGIAILLLIVLYFAAPAFINSEVVKKKVSTYFFQKTGGSITFQESGIYLFPVPYIEFRQLRITVPNKADSLIQSLDLYPAVWPLLRGDVQFSKISISSPSFTVALSEDMEKTSLEEIEEKIRAFVRDLTAIAPNSFVTIEKGKLDLTKENRVAFSFNTIQSEITTSGKSLNISLACASNLWDMLSLNSSLNADDLRSTGSVQMKHLRPHAVFAQLFPKTGNYIGDADADISVDFQALGLQQIQAEVESSFPLIIFRGGKNVTMKDLSIRGDIKWEPEKVSILLNELKISDPNLHVSGEYTLDRTSGIGKISLEGKSIDVNSTRESVLSIGGDIPAIRIIFNIVRGGTISVLQFSSGGKSFSDLGKLENIRITGQIQQGDISISAKDLSFHHVSGDVVIAEGILEGKNIEASIENHRGSRGQLRIGLKGKNAPFHLDMWVKADAGQLPSLLKQKHLITNEAVLREMDRLSDTHGSVEGKLILGDRLDSVHALIDVSQMNIATHYEPLPFPLAITEGRVFFDEKSITTTKLNGNLGNSSFNSLTARINLDDKAEFEINDGQMKISADEIYPWITSFETMKPILRDLPSMKGMVAISSLKLKGPLYQPKDWTYFVNGELNKFTLDAAFFPGKAEETTGIFRITHDELSLKDVRTRIIDSGITLSGTFRSFPADINSVDLSFQGEIGPKVTEWISALIKLPPDVSVRAPLSIKTSNLVWEKDTKTTFDGMLVFGRETKVSLKLTKTPDELSVHQISIKDRETDVAANLELRKDSLDFKFRGALTSDTFNSIFAQNKFSGSSLHGDLRAHIILSDPMQSVVEGVIAGENIPVLWKYDIPLVIQKINLDAQGKGVKVDSAQLSIGDQKFSGKGTIDTSHAFFSVDMDIFSDGFDWETIEKIVKGTKKPESSTKTGSLENFPLRGTLRIQSGFFQYRQFRWEPLHADVSLDGKTIHIRSKKAALCGISTTGDVDITPEGVEIDIALSAKNLELEPTILCISDKRVDVTGRFEMKADIKAKGKLDTIAKSLNGSFTISAKKGNIFKSKSLDKTLDLVNKTETVKGKLPDLDKTKIKYRVFAASGTIKEHMLEIEESVLDTSAFGIVAQGKVDLLNRTLDVNALVAPLNTGQRIVSKIPILGQLLGGSLVSIPVKIEGNLSDPQVNFLSPSAIGSALFGIVKRTVKLPITIIEPLLPEMKTE
jgi:AsmA-like C-terminal region/AsmA family